MSKACSVALAAHLAQATTSLATCWKVTRSDGQVFGFTDFDQDLTVSSQLYKASAGYTRSAVQTAADLNPDSVDLAGVFDDVSITEVDLRAGLWDYASVEMFLVNWNDLTQGVLKLRIGRLGEVKAGRHQYTAELRGLAQNIQQEIGRIYSPACNADFGDARCGLNAALFTVTGAVTSVSSNRTFNDTARTEADGYFDYGKITWTSGDNNGLSMEVKQSVQSGGAIALQLPMPFTVQVGDAYSMIAGCGKDIQVHCLLKFNNVVNFRGFPYVPGSDQMVTGGR